MRYEDDDNDDGYCSDETFVDNANSRHSRKSCQSFTCLSPLYTFSRWINGRKSRKNLKKTLEKERMRSGDDHIVSDETAGKDASFNLGLGFGLLYLIAASRNIELNKANNKQLCVSSNSRMICSSSSNINDSPHKKEGITNLSSRSLTLREVVFGSSRFIREKSLRMDQLEAELEAEFDRLQQHESSERQLEAADYYTEVNIEDSAPEESNNMSPEVINEVYYDHHEEGSIYNEFYSVPAIELERRLHELLEERQEEKINELESALEYAIQQLRDKEGELAWWRDTARLVRKHLPDIHDMFRQRPKQSSHHSNTMSFS